jgi:hypothetical protein
MLHDEQAPNKKRFFKKRGLKIRKFQHSPVRKEEERQINTTGVDSYYTLLKEFVNYRKTGL